MADIDISIVASELGKTLNSISPQVEAEIRSAVHNLAQAAYAAMVSKIQTLPVSQKVRKKYLNSLKFHSIDEGTWLIYLEGEGASQLEKGTPPYNIKDVLLKSQKIVDVGTRSGQPWVQKNKQGKKFAHVPFNHTPTKSGQSHSLGEEMKKIMVTNRSGNLQSITKVFKDLEGKPISGKVAQAGEHPTNPKLSGLVKYQTVSEAGKVSSVYVAYRTVSEDSTGWQHPGNKGLALFKEAEEYVNGELRNILNTIL